MKVYTEKRLKNTPVLMLLNNAVMFSDLFLLKIRVMCKCLENHVNCSMLTCLESLILK